MMECMIYYCITKHNKTSDLKYHTREFSGIFANKSILYIYSRIPLIWHPQELTGAGFPNSSHTDEVLIGS